jgi:iron complex outermembrane receptor protein
VLSARAWAQIDRVVLSGIGDGFSSCAAGSDPSCAAQETHTLSARGEVEAAFPIGGLQWATATLSGGSDWFAGQGAGVHRRGVGSLALRDEVTLLGGLLSLAPAVRLDAVGDDLAASPALGISLRPFVRMQARAAQRSASAQSMHSSSLATSTPSERTELTPVPLADADSFPSLLALLAPLEFRASAGTSFRAPSFAELYLQQGGTSPNPSLRPERAGSIDVGAAYHTARVTVAGTLFCSRYRDLILYELYPPAREKPFNVGQARVLGAELEALVVLPLGFTAELSWSYLDAIDERAAATEAGQKLPYRPPHRLFVRAARHGDRLEGFAQADFSSAMPRNQFGTTSLPSQFTLSCGLGARVIGPLWLDLELKNALDDQTQQDLFQYPLPGLSLTAIARARF